MAEPLSALIDFPGEGHEPNRRQRYRFERPVRWLVAHDASQVAGLLDEAHAQARAGHWCVGWVAYEAAPAFDPHLPVKALPPGTVLREWRLEDVLGVGGFGIGKTNEQPLSRVVSDLFAGAVEPETSSKKCRYRATIMPL